MSEQLQCGLCARLGTNDLDGPREHSPGCDKRAMGVGRSDFEERREARVERLDKRAAAKAAESASRIERVRSTASIMNGTPVLIGHHSEKRHRRDLDRMDTDMRKSIEADKEAKRLASAAAAAASNTAISSDDPDALSKLRAKLEAMESQREDYKAYNKKARKEGRDRLPSYVLSNLGANIRRVKQRLEELERRAGCEAREEQIGDVELRENPETNRVELDLGRRATKEECRSLKSHGFKWSRTNEVWQRLANESAWHCGKRLAHMISGEPEPAPEPTPAPAPEPPAPTPRRRKARPAGDPMTSEEVRDALDAGLSEALRPFVTVRATRTVGLPGVLLRFAHTLSERPIDRDNARGMLVLVRGWDRSGGGAPTLKAELLTCHDVPRLRARTDTPAKLIKYLLGFLSRSESALLGGTS